jgi:hypothetical protein
LSRSAPGLVVLSGTHENCRMIHLFSSMETRGSIINLARFLAVSGTVPDALGCILLRGMEDCSRYGTVDLPGNRVVGFHEKASINAPGVVSSGI